MCGINLSMLNLAMQKWQINKNGTHICRYVKRGKYWHISVHVTLQTTLHVGNMQYGFLQNTRYTLQLCVHITGVPIESETNCSIDTDLSYAYLQNLFTTRSSVHRHSQYSEQERLKSSQVKHVLGSFNKCATKQHDFVSFPNYTFCRKFNFEYQLWALLRRPTVTSFINIKSADVAIEIIP